MAFKALFAVTARPLRAVFILGILSSLILAAAVDAQQSVPAAGAPSTATSPAPAVKPAPFIRPPVAAGAAVNAATLAAKPDIRPLWAELTPIQQKVLAPLALEWNKLDTNHKLKWLAITAKYATMTPEQQNRLEKNISDWANMTPEQHRLARQSYARAKKLDAEQKTAQWQQYQQLPEEQKQRLAADAKEKKHIANVPSLQNKPKTVEPLKPPKKSLVNHNATLPNANHAALPTAGKPLTPTASASATAPAPTTTPQGTATPAATATPASTPANKQ